jgi:hypothetical protein
MSLDKTFNDQYRLPLKLDKYPVVDELPAHFESIYPKFIKFLETYYESYDADNSPAKFLNELQHNRDMADVTPHLLRFIGEELFLGKDYTEGFSDKTSAIQISNLLYRSKGTPFSIEQFFKIFFGFDVDIKYGRNEIFAVGDPLQEKLLYTSEMRVVGKDENGNRVLLLYPGSRLKFNFTDGVIDVSVLAITPLIETVPSLYINENIPPTYINDLTITDYIIRTAKKYTYNLFFSLRENIDYTIDYHNKSVVFLKPGLANSVKPGDPWLDHLAVYGELPPPDYEVDNRGQEFGPLRYPKSKIEINRRFPAGSPIGADIGEKRITDNAYYQIFSILIKTPIAVNAWKNVYKDFIHPSGTYLAGEVLLETKISSKLSAKPVNTEVFGSTFESSAIFGEESSSSVTELNARPRVLVPEPSTFVYNINNSNIQLPIYWDGSNANTTLKIYFNKKIMGTGDQWLLSGTVDGLKYGLLFPSATPSTLVYRYIEETTLNLTDLDVQQDVLLGATYRISLLSEGTGTGKQILTTSNGVTSVYTVNLAHQPRVDSIGDNFVGSIWEAYFFDPITRANVLQYPMREGSGKKFYAYKENREEKPAKDIVLSNEEWSNSNISVWKGNNIEVPEWISTSASGFKLKLRFSLENDVTQDSSLMWFNETPELGLSISADNKLHYLYTHSGGIEDVTIYQLNKDDEFEVTIEHGASSVSVTIKVNENSSTTTQTVSTAPSEVVTLNYIIGSNLTAIVWNVELTDLTDGSNSRYYPMQDGSGNTMLAYDNGGNPTGSTEDADANGGTWVDRNYLKYGED